MQKITYNKLVRDRIPEIMQARGKQFEVQSVTEDQQFLQLLLRKLTEEAAEAQTAHGDKLVEELADLQEVINALCGVLGVSVADLETTRQQKALARGAFEERLFLVWGEAD